MSREQGLGDRGAESTSTDAEEARVIKPYKGVLIIGYEHNDPGPLQKLIDEYNKSADQGYLVVGTPDRGFSLEEIQEKLSGRVDANTRIDVIAHGDIDREDGEHCLVAGLDENKSPFFANTKDLISTINSTTTTGTQIHLKACFSGAAIKYIELSNNSSLLVAHADDANVSFGFHMSREMIKFMHRDPQPNWAEIMVRFEEEYGYNGINIAVKHADGSCNMVKHKVTLQEIIHEESMRHVVTERAKFLFTTLGKDIPREFVGDIPERIERGEDILSLISSNRDEAKEIFAKIVSKMALLELRYLLRRFAYNEVDKDQWQWFNQLTSGEVKKLDNLAPIIAEISLLSNTDELTAKTQDGSVKGMLEKFLAKGADINACSQDHGYNALHTGAFRGNEKLVAILLDLGADVDFKARNGMTALDRAASNKRTEVVKTLIAHGADIQKVGASALEGLILADVDISEVKNALKDQALFIAASKGNLEVAKNLIEKGANIEALDEEGVSPLLKAISFNKQDMVKELVNLGADINKTPAHLVESLIVAGVDISNLSQELKDKAFLNAVGKGHLKTAETLLNKGANIEAQNSKGVGGLVIAESKGHMHMLKLLVERGSNLKNINPSMVGSLINAKIDISSISPSIKRNALIKAVGEGKIKYVAKIINSDPNLKSMSFFKKAFLYIATIRKKTNKAKAILKGEVNDIEKVIKKEIERLDRVSPIKALQARKALDKAKNEIKTQGLDEDTRAKADILVAELSEVFKQKRSALPIIPKSLKKLKIAAVKSARR